MFCTELELNGNSLINMSLYLTFPIASSEVNNKFKRDIYYLLSMFEYMFRTTEFV